MAKPAVSRSTKQRVDRADFVELDDAELVRPRPGRRWCWAVPTMPTSTLSLPPALVSSCGDEFVERLAGDEPFLAAIDEHVVDGQLAGGRVAALGVDLEADAAAFEGDDRFFEGGQRADEAGHRFAFDDLAVAGIERGVGEAEVEQLGPHFLFGLDVVGVRLAADAEQRRLGDVDVAGGDQVVHLAVEEGEQQRADVGAVDVGVGHDHDAAVAALGEVLVLADAGADGGDHAADFFVGEHFVLARLVGVDDLAAQGEDGLELALPAALGGAAGRIAFDQEQLALVDVAAGAVAELAGQAAAGERALAFADELLLLAGGDAGLGGQQALADDRLGGLGVLFEEFAEVLAERAS